MGHAKILLTLDLNVHAILTYDQNVTNVMEEITRTSDYYKVQITNHTTRRHSVLASAKKRAKRETRRA